MMKNTLIGRSPSSPAQARGVIARGFTLIELMVTVAIVAILASIAYPSYTAYVRRGAQAEAFEGLANARVKMEQYYQDNRVYGTGGSDCGVPNTALQSSKYFTFTCAKGSTGDWQSYTYTATGSGIVAGYDYTVDQSSNYKHTVKFAGSNVTLDGWCKKSTSDC